MLGEGLGRRVGWLSRPSMRVLFVTPFPIVPEAPHGGGSYLGALVAAMRATAEIGVACLGAGATAPHDPAAGLWAARHPAQRGLPARLANLWRWRNSPLVAAKAWNPEFARLLGEAVATFRPDVACVEMAQMAQYLPFLKPVPTVLTDHEAGCPANVRTGLGTFGDARDRRLWRSYVQRWFPACDRLQALTQEDAAELGTLVGRPVHVRPPVVALPNQPVEVAAAPPRALFLGDFRHGPNPDAARRLAHEVLPAVRRLVPDAELWLAGPNEGCIGDLANVPGLRVLGFVHDLPRLFGQVRLLLAPLWSGRGFRVKVATALAHGLPVVTNDLGARGLPAPPPALQRADTPAELAERTAPLLQTPTLARDAGAAAFAWARDHLAASTVAAAQVQSLAAWLRQREAGVAPSRC